MTQARTTAPAASNPTIKKVPLTTSFENENEKSLYRRLLAYTKAKGFNKPQDVVRLAVSKFLDKEDS
jgi:hypothetical protein